MTTNTPKLSTPSLFTTPEFLKNLGRDSEVFSKTRPLSRDVVIVSDFDHTLTRNDCGAQVAVLAGVSEPEFFELAKQVGLKNPQIEKGAEFATLMLAEPKMNRAGRAGIHAAVDKIVLKDEVGAMYRALEQGIGGHNIHFYVVSAGPQEAVRGALAKVAVPSDHVIGTRLVYDGEGRPISVLHASAGRGKVALIDDLKALHQIPGKNLIYFGDGSSDIEAMKHVQKEGGYNIAVEDNASLRPYRSLLLKSDNVTDWLAPIAKRIVSLEAASCVGVVADIKAFVQSAQKDLVTGAPSVSQAAA